MYVKFMVINYEFKSYYAQGYVSIDNEFDISIKYVKYLHFSNISIFQNIIALTRDG